MGRTHLSLGVVGLHDLDLDTKDTLTEENVTDGVVDKVAVGLTGVDHETVGELHRLCTGSTQLAGNNDLATLGARLHDEAEDTVASAAHGKTTEELVAERLGLGDGGKTTVLDLLSVELERVLGELETLLDQSLELADTTSLVTEDLLGVGGADDDLGTGVGDTDLTARVTLLGELTSAGVSITPWFEIESTHKNSESSAWKTPSATNFLFLEIWWEDEAMMTCWVGERNSRLIQLAAARGAGAISKFGDLIPSGFGLCRRGYSMWHRGIISNHGLFVIII